MAQENDAAMETRVIEEVDEREIEGMVAELNARLRLVPGCAFQAEIHRDDYPKFRDRIRIWDDNNEAVIDEATFKKAMQAASYDEVWEAIG